MLLFIITLSTAHLRLHIRESLPVLGCLLKLLWAVVPSFLLSCTEPALRLTADIYVGTSAAKIVAK